MPPDDEKTARELGEHSKAIEELKANKTAQWKDIKELQKYVRGLLTMRTFLIIVGIIAVILMGLGSYTVGTRDVISDVRGDMKVVQSQLERVDKNIEKLANK